MMRGMKTTSAVPLKRKYDEAKPQSPTGSSPSLHVHTAIPSRNTRPKPMALLIDTNIPPTEEVPSPVHSIFADLPPIDDGELDQGDDENSDVDSLFDEPPSPITTTTLTTSTCTPSATSSRSQTPPRPVLRTAPPISGLYFPKILLPPDLAHEIFCQCISTFFPPTSASNQVMLFTRANSPSPSIPSFLTDLLGIISETLGPVVPADVYKLLFDPYGNGGGERARQVIVNLYEIGEGISPHVDLLDRYGDGIVGVSFGSGCVMQFEEVSRCQGERVEGGREQYDVYLPPRSVIIMTGKARYEVTHGIEGRLADFVELAGQEGNEKPDERDESQMRGEWLERTRRVSVTFRWLLPGADVVGKIVDENYGDD